MNDEERFDSRLRELARELDPPPPVPREAMWRVIETRRAAGRRVTVVRRFPRWVRWAPALAAMLVLGVGIGRMLRPAAEPPAATQTVAGAPLSDVGYEFAALRHMASAEALLVAFPGDARAGRIAEAAGWARELLTDTRLLAESPVSEDADVARLLDDLEMVLVQIAALEGEERHGDVTLIEDGIQQNDVLLRLRAVTSNVAAGL